MHLISHLIFLDLNHLNKIWRELQIVKIIVMNVFPSQIITFPLCLNIPFGTLFLNKIRYTRIYALEG
jgi:hypothetical protein